MADSGIRAHGFETLPLTALPFRFELSWHSVTWSLSPTPRDFRIPSSGDRAPEDLPAAQAPANNADAREWEMVLPRLVRPVARPASPVAGLGITARPLTLLGRLTRLAGLTLVSILFLALYRSMRPNFAPVAAQPPAAQAGTSTKTGGSEWIAEWASDSTGAARGRQIALYRPSQGRGARSDCRGMG